MTEHLSPLDAMFLELEQADDSAHMHIGAVAILIVFAILLTRGSEPPQQAIFSSSWIMGVAVAVIVTGLLAGLIFSSHALTREAATGVGASVQQIGESLMTKYVLPLQVVGLLLTAALIGAVIIAMKEKEPK